MATYGRIEINPDVMLGKPVIHGTRLSVELLLRRLAEGATEDDLGTVLSSATQIYRNPANGLLYRRVMYPIYQGPSDAAAGRVCLSFSNANSDANDWTPPIAAVLSPTAPRGLACNMTNATILAEAIGAYHRTSTTIHLFGLQGNRAILEQSLGTSKTRRSSSPQLRRPQTS